MLNVSDTGLLKHMFGCLDRLIEGPNSKKKDKESFDDLHHYLVRDSEQQSVRDFPHMSIRNGITDGTKMCGSERVGNCIVLLCVMHTHSGKKMMLKEMKEREISLKRFKNCLKLYLSFNCWLKNDPHPRSQVHQSSIALSNLINLRSRVAEWLGGAESSKRSRVRSLCKRRS
jgi:hypothetical protein